MARSPYSGRPQRAFWRGGVAGNDPFPDDIYRPRFPITNETRIFTAGSCFAQHVGAALKDAGCSVIDTEPARRGMLDTTARRYGYGLYSARFGNIYTLRQFRQLIEEAIGQFTPACPVWEKGERFWDALRPGVEPEGVASPEIVAEMRKQHLGKVRTALAQTDVIVFTLGLTEAWEHRETGTIYPTAPGTIAGDHDPDIFAFRDFTVADMLEDFAALQEVLDDIAPGLRYILTVSPVPLAATASDWHVLTATMRSKAALRVVCDMLCDGSDRIDYFPSYDMVMSPAQTGGAFADDLRSVRPEVVSAIMSRFLAAHGLTQAAAHTPSPELDPQDDVICEEALLEAFRP